MERKSGRKQPRLSKTVTLILLIGVTTEVSVSSFGTTTSTQSDASGSFEVESIRVNTLRTGGFSYRVSPGGGFVGTGVTAEFLLEQAYGVRTSQVLGAPAWFDSVRYDIEAKPDEAVQRSFEKLPTLERQQMVSNMLKRLLEKRFGLLLRSDTKVEKVLALTVAKGGPKMVRVSSGTSNTPRADEQTPAPQPQALGSLVTDGRGSIVSTGASMSTLANVLANAMRTIVIDRTNLTGEYVFTLNWEPESPDVLETEGHSASKSDGFTPQAGNSGPSIFTAIREQLGLVLRSNKVAIPVLVIDRVERASPN